MSFSRPLKFKAAGRNEFLPLFGVLFMILLLFLATMILPFIVAAALALLSTAVFIAFKLKFRKAVGADLISVISPNGRVTLESGKKTTIEGFLCGEQWSTSHIAVLRYQTGGKHQQMVLFSVQQHADDYRRLQVWLRHGVFEDKDNTAVPGSSPA